MTVRSSSTLWRIIVPIGVLEAGQRFDWINGLNFFNTVAGYVVYAVGIWRGGDFRFVVPIIAVGASEASSKGVCGRRVAGSAKYKSGMAGHRIYRTSVASVYPHYVTKVEKKGRTKEEVDEILCWLTGYGERARRAAGARHGLREVLRRGSCVESVAEAHHRRDLRRPRRGDRGPAHAGDPLPRQAR